MTIAELEKEYFSAATRPIAPEDFSILLAHILGAAKTWVYAHPEYFLEERAERQARDFFARRAWHEPVAYILGSKEFYGRNFQVTPATLVPRPETECLVELVLQTLSRQQTAGAKYPKALTIVDVGTGSGNIIISLAKEAGIRNIAYHAIDISADALSVAKQNAVHHAVAQQITFQHGDLLLPVHRALQTAEEIIITANLPYLSPLLYAAAPPDVRHYEPIQALVSSEAGLAHISRLLQEASGLGKPTTLFLEISPEQSPLLRAQIANVFPQARFTVSCDLSGLERVACVEMRSQSK